MSGAIATIPHAGPSSTPTKALKRKGGEETESSPSKEVSGIGIGAATPSKKSRTTEIVKTMTTRSTRSKGFAPVPSIESINVGTVLQLPEVDYCERGAPCIENGTYFRVVRVVGKSKMLVIEVKELVVAPRSEDANLVFGDSSETSLALKVQFHETDKRKKTDALKVEWKICEAISRAATDLALPPFLVLPMYWAEVDWASAKDAPKMRGGELVGWTRGRMTAMGMELGTPLTTILEAGCDPERFHTLIASACTALTNMHTAGFVHRDIKIDNFIVARKQDGTGEPVITDGVRLIDAELATRKGAVWERNGIVVTDLGGTVPYMSLGLISQWIVVIIQAAILRVNTVTVAKEVCESESYGEHIDADDAEECSKKPTVEHGWTAEQLSWLGGLASASGSGDIEETSDFWALGMSLLERLDPVWFRTPRNVITRDELDWFEVATSGDVPASFAEVEARITSLQRIFSPITDGKTYLRRLDGHGKRVFGSTGNVDEKTYGGVLGLLLSREAVRGAGGALPEEGQQRKLETAFGLLATKAGPKSNIDDTAGSSLAAVASESSSKVDLKGLASSHHDSGMISSAGPSVSSTTSLKNKGKGKAKGAPAKRIAVEVVICSRLVGTQLVFQYPKVEKGGGVKRTYVYKCGLAGCVATSEEGPYSTIRCETMMRHLKGNGWIDRCTYFADEKSLPYVGMKVLESEGTVFRDWDGTSEI